ncbi:MAG: hypothetical protein Q7T55_04830 [Solirubrobacteraceae bacterium]|nr:hypothetical protein [Solirubrobacteraceae bacterium]
MPSDHLIWSSIPTLAPGGPAPGAARRRRTDAVARRLQAERAAMAAITAWQGEASRDRGASHARAPGCRS